MRLSTHSISGVAKPQSNQLQQTWELHSKGKHEKNTILIVDDEPQNLAVLEQILSDLYDLIFARNGAEALVVVLHHLLDGGEIGSLEALSEAA